jgi:hypothetical protein
MFIHLFFRPCTLQSLFFVSIASQDKVTCLKSYLSLSIVSRLLAIILTDNHRKEKEKYMRKNKYLIKYKI